MAFGHKAAAAGKLPTDDVKTVLDALLKETRFEPFARQASIHADLPELMLAIAGASTNEDLYTYLQDQVKLEGTVRGRSKQKAVVEEDEEPIDSELEYTRPNGEIYYSRKWSGHKDVEVLRTARKHDKAPLFYGPPGTGKTALIDATFPDLITVVMTGDTEVTDLVGGFVPNPANGIDPNAPQFIWADGPLVIAAIEGRPLLLDEIGLGDPKVLSIVYGLMDGRRELVVSANPSRGTVKAEEGFFVIGATNPNAPGVRISEALLSRFALHVEVTTDWKLAVKLGVPSKIVSVAENLQHKVEEGVITWAPQFRELLAYRDLAKVYGAEFANNNLLAVCPEVDRDIVTEMFRAGFGKSASPAQI